MELFQAPENLKKFRKTSWKFQQTFLTPLKNLSPFVAAIVSAIPGIRSGQVTIEQAVFEPKRWMELLGSYSIEPRYSRGTSVKALAAEEITSLLEVSFSGWFDFIFVPEPRPFAIYADHDEYTTFFTQTRSNLNRVVEPVTSSGAKPVLNYQRDL